MPPGARYTWPDGTIHSTPYQSGDAKDNPNYGFTTPDSYERYLGQQRQPRIPAGVMPNYAIPNYTFPQGSFPVAPPIGPGGTGGLPRMTGSIDDYIRSNYGNLAAFLNDPEIGPILRKAASEGWDMARLFGAISQTNWWKTSSQSVREWDMLMAEDPAEAAARAGQVAAMVQNRANTLGLNMSADQIQGLAIDATRNGWTDAQVVDQLLANLNWSSLQGGDLTALRDQVRQIGAQFLVGVSDSTAQNYAARIASGELTEQGVASIMQAQAATRFPWMMSQIEQGVTPSDYIMPVRDRIAQELALAPEAVDMMDPQWLGMIEMRDPKTGEMRAATLDEATLAARRRPEYWSTDRAQQSMASMKRTIDEVFGRGAI